MSDDVRILFMTWTTYDNWLPGDSRGWRKLHRGPQAPSRGLEVWHERRLVSRPRLLDFVQRRVIDQALVDVCQAKAWELHARNVRTNHVHIVLATTKLPKLVRDQLKAHATTQLRRLQPDRTLDRVWARGGDIELIDEDELEQVVLYVNEAQDRPR